MARTARLYETRDVIARLLKEGWIEVKGRGDHRNFKHRQRPGKVTIDAGRREIPVGTLRSIYRQAGWDW